MRLSSVAQRVYHRWPNLPLRGMHTVRFSTLFWVVCVLRACVRLSTLFWVVCSVCTHDHESNTVGLRARTITPRPALPLHLIGAVRWVPRRRDLIFRLLLLTHVVLFWVVCDCVHGWDNFKKAFVMLRFSFCNVSILEIISFILWPMGNGSYQRDIVQCDTTASFPHLNAHVRILDFLCLHLQRKAK